MDDILTVKQVAKYFKVNEITIYRLASSGKIPAFKVGHQWRFKFKDINRWAEEKDIFSRKRGRVLG